MEMTENNNNTPLLTTIFNDLMAFNRGLLEVYESDKPLLTACILAFRYVDQKVSEFTARVEAPPQFQI